MDNVFKNAKWIWYEENNRPDTYGDFYLQYYCDKIEKTVINLSCDSDYALYINGEYVTSNQYSDFEYYKIYDAIDITKYLKKGKNDIAIEVWYFGVESQKYCQASAGLIFNIVSDSQIVNSDENVLSRQDICYRNGKCKKINYQLGFTFYYDITKEDNWKLGNISTFNKSAIVDKDCIFYVRPNEKLQLLDKITPLNTKKWHNKLSVFTDLGKESVGLLYVEFDSPIEQNVMIIWSEVLSAGNVRRYMSGNDYSVELYAKKGKNVYFNPFLRFGCRYIQIDSVEEIEVTYLGLKPFLYPLKEKPCNLILSENQKKIYDICVETLKLCAFEHYVDCPFREQGLYTFDSRNQMLCGYFAMEGTDYQLSNLLLLAMDKREDKLLSITAPCKADLVIPAYSLYYVIQVWEYLKYSNAKELNKAIINKISEVINVFINNMANNIVNTFKGKSYWNFYDWSPNLNGYGANKEHDGEPDLIINCLFIIAYESYIKICEALSIDNKFNIDLRSIKNAVKDYFYDKEDGLMSMYNGLKTYTQLGNSLSILADVVTNDKLIIDKLITGETTDCSLSMKTFYYDALLKVDAKNKDIVLKEIEDNYTYMLNHGATSVWETMESPIDGGSFCHGWSAIPVYYYNILLR